MKKKNLPPVRCNSFSTEATECSSTRSSSLLMSPEVDVSTQTQQNALPKGGQHPDGGAAANDRRVRFKSARVRTTRSWKHYTEQEIKNCWYSREEYASMSQSCAKSVKAILLNKASNGKDDHEAQGRHELRGLEYHIGRLASRSTSKHLQNAWYSVFATQAQQRLSGQIDPEAIAKKYGDVAHLARVWAVRLALQDQRDANLFYGRKYS